MSDQHSFIIQGKNKISANTTGAGNAGASLVDNRQQRGIGSFGSHPVQRVIRSPGPIAFTIDGRAGEHATAVNQHALAELRAHRAVHPDAAQRHVNNEREQAVVAGLPTPVLHIAHHVSDAVIQDMVMRAANSPVPAWGLIQVYIAGIAPPPGVAAALPYFYAASLAAHNAAAAALAVVMAAHPVPLNAAMAAQLTIIANSIANSPMNLHLGDGQTNMSIGQHGDPNMHPRPGLQRQMTWRSHRMRATLAAAGINPAQYDRTLAHARLMPGTVAGGQAAAFPAVAAGTAATYTQNSASPGAFAQPV
jgi:hypothetical protein